MVRAIAYLSACVGLAILLVAANAYLGLSGFADGTSITSDNFVLRSLLNQYVENAGANIDAALLYHWLWNRVVAIGAFGIFILGVAFAVILYKPRKPLPHE